MTSLFTKEEKQEPDVFLLILILNENLTQYKMAGCPKRSGVSPGILQGFMNLYVQSDNF